jgi:predicted aldo/keto reductase-like oxidoreductase
MKGQNRRDFLKRGAAGLAGAAVMTAVRPLEGESGYRSPQQKNRFIYRTLGNTGIKIPIISIGAASEDPGLYKSALDSGITHIDTSQYYFNGRHERIVGDAVKGRPRDSFIIATSMLLGDRESSRHSLLLLEKTDTIGEKFNGSLERLGLEYVDIFYIAGVSNRDVARNDKLIASLQKLKKDGKAKFIGIAAHENEPEVLRAAVELGVHDVVLVALNFKQKHRAEIKKAAAEAAASGLGIVVMKPVAGAFWDRERTQPINGKAALKWVLQDENITTVVPGITTMEQLQADLSILDNPALTAEEIKDLRLDEFQETPGLYCQQCGECRMSCPEDLDIPLLMRSYMYAYGYQDLGRAAGAMEQVVHKTNACESCSSCRVKCAQGFNVRERIIDIVRLAEIPSEFLGG